MYMVNSNRICILGNGSSGKTNLANQIKYNRFVLHLDSIYWKNGSYTHHDRDYFLNEVDKVLALPSWVIEGTPMPGLEKRINKADLIIFLDVSLYICLYRLIKRELKKLLRIRKPDCGCPAKFNIKTIKWIIKFNGKPRQLILKKINETGNNKKLMLVKNRKTLKK